MSDPDQEVIIKPGVGMFKVQASERVILLPAGPSARILAARFLAQRKSIRPYPSRLFRLKRQGVEIDLVGPAMGAPVAAMALEQLVAGGAKKIVMIGFAGSIDPALTIGDLILVKEAISDEGTSRNYFPEQNPPLASSALLSEAASELGLRGEKIQTCAVATTDGFFRETREKLARFREQGALAVEMELSALYTIAKYRQVELLGMMVISDELVGKDWKAGFKSPRILISLMHAGEIALAVLSK